MRTILRLCSLGLTTRAEVRRKYDAPHVVPRPYLLDRRRGDADQSDSPPRPVN